MHIRRKDINKDEIKDELVTLHYTVHAMNRIKERINGSLLLYPKVLKKGASNINFIDTDKMSWGYSIRWKRNVSMILVMNNTNVVKTVYFKDAKFK